MRAQATLTFAFMFLLTGGAHAQPPGPEAPAAQPSQKIICVRGQAETGSHFSASKVCHTESEWATIHNQSGRMLERSDTLQNKQSAPGGGH